MTKRGPASTCIETFEITQKKKEKTRELPRDDFFFKKEKKGKFQFQIHFRLQLLNVILESKWKVVFP